MAPIGFDQYRERQLRRLAMHEEAVRVLQRAPERAARVLEVLDRWDALGGAVRAERRELWRNLAIERNWGALLDDTEAGDELRRGSPFTFVLDEAVRAAVFRRFSSTGSLHG